MKHIQPFETAQLEAIAKVLGDTDAGMTGSEIGHVLAQCQVTDVDPQNTKWKRLFNALAHRQNQERHGNHVVAFIHKAMKPARWAGKTDAFDELRARLNVPLALAGLHLDAGGELHATDVVRTLPEAELRADRLRAALRARRVHEDVLKFCRGELLQVNYFHAVLEAVKSVADKIRSISGLDLDGADLATRALAVGKSGQPLIAINSLTSETERGEQRGFTNLLIGLFGMFRNPLAHEAKIYWPMDELDAMDILSMVSLLHRKLDSARRV